MKKLLVSLMAMILAMLTAFTFTACGETDASSNGSENGQSSDGKKYVMIGYTDYAPMNYTDENNELVGFDTELAKKVFTELGYEVGFKLIEWGNKYQELNGGTIDCIWNGFTANAEDEGTPRDQLVDFTYYYMQNAQCIVKRASAENITSVEGFVGKSVAFEAGSAGQSYVDGLEVNTYKKSVISQMDAIREVNSGTADYAVVDILLAESLVGNNDYAGISINEGIDIGVEYYAVGFKKGSDLTAKVNELFVKYAEDGYLMQLAEKYKLETKLLTNFNEQN